MGNVLGYVDARLQVRISPEGLSCDFCERGQNSLENLSRYPTISISISLNPMNWTIQNWLSSSASRTRDSWSFVFDFQEFYSAFTKSKVRLSLDIRVIMFVAKKTSKFRFTVFSLQSSVSKNLPSWTYSTQQSSKFVVPSYTFLAQLGLKNVVPY